MFKQGDVILIGEDAPNVRYVGTIFRMLEDMREANIDEIPVVEGRVEVLKSEAMQQHREGDKLTFTERWQRALTKIGERDIYVGQRVRIREDSQFYGPAHDRSNPIGVVGEVVSLSPDEGLPLYVAWGNGYNNVYSFEDLEVVTETPKPRKKGKKSPGILAQISKAVEVLHSYDDNPTASYVIVYPKELPRRRESNTACHNGLRTEESGARLVVSCVKRGIDDHPWFYKWLIDESPWSSAFYRRYAWSKKNKCVAVRTDIAANFMFGALFATRVWENPEAMEFVKAFKNKLPISFLYAISKVVRRNGRQFSIDRARGGHWPFEHSPSKEVVKNFVLGTPKTLTETYSELGNAPYESVSRCFGESNDYKYWLFEASQEDELVKRRVVLGVSKVFFDGKEKFLEFLTKQYDEVMK